MQEKRKFFRLPFEERVEFICPKGIFRGTLKNISFGGLYIEEPEDYPDLKDEIALIFLLKDTDPPIKIFMKGRVVRIDENKGFALKILSITNESFQHLKNYLIYNAPSPEIAELEVRKFLGDFDSPHQLVKAFNIFWLKNEILPFILDRAFLYSPERPFRLSSGKESPYYLDCRKITLYGACYKLIGDLFWEELRYTDIQGVAGMSMGADPIVCGILSSALAEERSLEGILIRKEPKKYGMGKQLEGNYWKGMKVAVVEDVVTTGGSLLKAIEACEREELIITSVLTFVDREEGGKEALRERGYDLKAFFTLSEIISAYQALKHS
jgi:orotate phosphoribosyltransferase